MAFPELGHHLLFVGLPGGNSPTFFDALGYQFLNWVPREETFRQILMPRAIAFVMGVPERDPPP